MILSFISGGGIDPSPDLCFINNYPMMRTTTVKRFPNRNPEIALKPSQQRSIKTTADSNDKPIAPFLSPPRVRKLPYGGYRGAELWPDGELRINDPVRYLDADRELIAILETLATLNRTGLYSAFYDYAPHVGTLTVRIYEGRWTCFKKNVLKASIDCRRSPLRDNDTNGEVTAEEFIRRLIGLVQ